MNSRSASGAGLAVAAMLCVQIGIVASAGLFDQLGPLGTAWVRLMWAAIFVVVWLRPNLRRMSNVSTIGAAALGVVSGALTIFYMLAIARLPLGTASALSFIGPLGVAVSQCRRSINVFWSGCAGLGVMVLTEPWHPGLDQLGVLFALSTAGCWAAYILLTQRVGDSLPGMQGLAISLPVAAVCATVIVLPNAFGRLTWQSVVIGAGVALLLPVIPYSLEMLALQRISAGSFGTLMSLEPAIATLAGLIVLNQYPNTSSVLGVTLVVVAGLGSQQHSARAMPPTPQ